MLLSSVTSCPAAHTHVTSPGIFVHFVKDMRRSRVAGKVASPPRFQIFDLGAERARWRPSVMPSPFATSNAAAHASSLASVLAVEVFAAPPALCVGWFLDGMRQTQW